MRSFIAIFTVLAGLVSFAVTEIGTRADNPVFGYAALGNTTGGGNGPTIRVSTLADLKSAVSGSSPKTVILTASLTGKACVEIGSNTSLLGANNVTLHGIGLRILGVSNVVVKNLKISKVLASAGDAIGIQQASKVWVDHVDLSSDRDHGKDYYDGLLDITHGSTYVTVSNSYLHDHCKTSLIGHSDLNGQQDKSITVTYAYNYFTRINSRGPSVRFGHCHVFNNFYKDVGDAIDTREGAQLLVESNIFDDTIKPLFPTDNGYAVARGNDFGGRSDSAPNGTFTSAPYKYPLLSLDSVRSQVPSSAGATLNF